MTQSLRHRPYDGSARPFTISMRPLDPARWFEPDEHSARDLAEKAALLRDDRDAVFRAVTGSEHAQAESLALLVEYLAKQYPRETSAATFAGEPPLMQAARLVQDDLCILQHLDGAWHLTAAALCFPSSWSLAEKIGQPMSIIHEDVPDFAGQMASRVKRIFDNLKPDMPVERFNWSIYGDARLRHPETSVAPEERFPLGAELLQRAHIRVERQTLRKLPTTGAILFTIRIYVDPFSAFRQHSEGQVLAAALRAQLLALTPEQLDYKGLTDHRDALAAALQDIGSEAVLTTGG